MSPKRKRRI